MSSHPQVSEGIGSDLGHSDWCELIPNYSFDLYFSSKW